MPEIERLAGKQFFGAHAFHMRTALGGTFIRDKKTKQQKNGDSDARCECPRYANAGGWM